ncbi:hypothetical protein NQZ68_012044 [Dissostichus eleginoides]|nr:hypothetical protein NQZ68_012044 [Dissostichus eleginoides]
MAEQRIQQNNPHAYQRIMHPSPRFLCEGCRQELQRRPYETTASSLRKPLTFELLEHRLTTHFDLSPSQLASRDVWTTGEPLNTDFAAGCSHGTMPAHMCGPSGRTPGTHTHTILTEYLLI